MAMHPIDYFRRKGVPVTVNTDNRTVSDTTLTHEYEILQHHFGWDEHVFKDIYKTAVGCAYCNDETRQWLLTFID